MSEQDWYDFILMLKRSLTMIVSWCDRWLDKYAQRRKVYGGGNWNLGNIQEHRDESTPITPEGDKK